MLLRKNAIGRAVRVIAERFNDNPRADAQRAPME